MTMVFEIISVETYTLAKQHNLTIHGFRDSTQQSIVGGLQEARALEWGNGQTLSV